MAGLGASVEIGRLTRLSSTSQGAIDSAALSAAVDETMTSSRARAIFDNNLENPDATVSNFTFSRDSATGVVTVSGTVSAPSVFGGVLGIDTLSTNVRAEAKASDPKIKTATMAITGAQGAFDKQIYFVTRDKAGAELSRTLMLTYDYTLSGGRGRVTNTPTIGSSTTITVSNYETYDIEMVVYEDNNYRGGRTNPKTLKMSANNASTFLRTTGTCSTGSGMTMNWEDGGDSNFLDFRGTMSCTLSGTGTEQAYLMR